MRAIYDSSLIIISQFSTQCRTEGGQLRNHAPAGKTTTKHRQFVSYESCGNFIIAFELHMRCQQSGNGNFEICSRCWGLGRGCLPWYAFGKSGSIGRYFFLHPSCNLLRDLPKILSLRLSSSDMERRVTFLWYAKNT